MHRQHSRRSIRRTFGASADARQCCCPDHDRAMASRPARGMRAAWSLIAALFAFPVAQAQVVANESPVVLQSDFVDPEYSQARADVTWVDKSGALWVAGVDRDT